MIKLFSISLGCPKNRVDTEKTLGFFSDLKPVSTPEKADLVFINTCGFIAPAIEESVRTIVENITAIQALPANRRPLLVVAGCMVGRFGKTALLPDLPEVDLLLDNNELHSWGMQIAGKMAERKERIRLLAGKKATARHTAEKTFTQASIRLLSTGPSYAYLKISDGCRHACSFCTIPSIRGKLASYPANELVREAEFLVEQGIKEIVLVAQDVTAYGKDARANLQGLLEQLVQVKGLSWLRLMYLYPAGLDEQLLAFLQAAGRPFIPYFDIPVQHASPAILAQMGRPFATDPRKAIDRVRKFFPDAALRTSIITGFPGETEGDFAILERFVKDVEFTHLGVFTYQPEEGTKAALMPDQVPEKVKDWRKDVLMDIQGEISEKLLQEYVGSEQEVLVDTEHEEWPGLHLGRTWFQAPEIDGATYVSGPGTKPGALVKAEIMESDTYDLVALVNP